MFRNLYKKTIAILLAAALILEIIPCAAYADEGTNTAETSGKYTSEITTLREESIKHFRGSDGNITAVSYASPVHYEENGTWKEIDDRPEKVTTAGKTEYVTENGDIRTAFSGILDTGTVFSQKNTSTDGEKEIKLILAQGEDLPEGASSPRLNAQAELSESVLSENAWENEDLLPAGYSQKITYKDAFAGADLVYDHEGYDIKESIVVKETCTEYRYAFKLQLTGLTAETEEDGSVKIKSGEETVYEIPCAFMYDAEGSVSHEVRYITEAAEDGLIMTVEADAGWINASERVLPVTIDPTVAYVVRTRNSDITSSFKCYNGPWHYDTQDVSIGYTTYNSLGDMQAFVDISDLPDIPAGAEVVSTVLAMNMYDSGSYSYIGSDMTSINVAAYEITSQKPAGQSMQSWLTGMGWSSLQALSRSAVLDYMTVSAGMESQWISWDITGTARNWYEGSGSQKLLNLRAVETFSNSHCANITVFGRHASRGARLLVTYRDTAGIEPYYSYRAIDLGNAGTAYIAHSSGQLTLVKQVAYYGSEICPFSMSLVYNSDYFRENSTASDGISSELGLDMKMGNGFKYDVQQRVTEESLEGTGTWLRYTDGDGTSHYFSGDPDRQAGYYYDEDGLGLKITKSGQTYIMSDDKGNTWTFARAGLLTSVKDSSGNEILVDYQTPTSVGNWFYTVSQKNSGQSAKVLARVTYTEGSKIGTLTDYAGRVQSFVYDSSGRLTGIKLNGTYTAQYTYSGNRITKIKDCESGYETELSYDAEGRISSFTEKNGNTYGITETISYSGSITSYTDPGSNRGSGGTTYVTHYASDYAGRTVNAWTSDPDGNVTGASNAVLSGKGTTDKKNNRTLQAASAGGTSRIYLYDGSMEEGSSTSGWILDTSEGSGISASWCSDPAYVRTGTYSFKGIIASGATGWTGIRRLSRYLSAGKTYTLSCYVNTSQMTSFGGNGIYLYAIGHGHSWSGQSVKYKTQQSADGGWVRISLSFTPDESGTYRIAVYSEDSIGTFYADDFQLEEGEELSSRNLLDNAEIRGSASYWTMGTGASYCSTEGLFSLSANAGCIRVDGDIKSSTRAMQSVKLKLPGSRTYVLSGWAKADAVPDNIHSESNDAADLHKQFGLRAVLTYTDDTTEYFYAPFCTDLSDWQYVSLAIVPKHPEKTVDRIRVDCAYERNANTAYFDNICLTAEAAQTLRYDDDGNLVSVVSTGGPEQSAVYSGGDLIALYTGGNGNYTLNYDSSHRLTSATDGIVTESITYNSKGNVAGTALSGGSLHTSSSAQYSSDGNRLVSVTDSRGKQTQYSYTAVYTDTTSDMYEMLGNPAKVTDANGTGFKTTYDSHGRLKEQWITATADVEYTYTAGELTKAERRINGSLSADQEYGITRNAFGDITQLKVGNRTLETNTYSTNSRLLTRTDLGNGARTDLTYDAFGRVSSKQIQGGRTVEYSYTKDGALYSSKDSTESFTRYYNTDSLGRHLGTSTSDGTASTWTRYDDRNRVVQKRYAIPELSHASEIFTYNTNSNDSIADGALTQMDMYCGGSIAYTYDSLERLTQKSIGNSLTETYTYLSGSGNDTTNLVSKKTVKYNGTKILEDSYSYDDVGNISRITHKDGSYKDYTYDSQSQLTGAVKKNSAGTVLSTESYTISSNGNITSFSSAAGNHSLQYTDSSWKDLLTSVDGHSITSDGAGNPLSYYDGYSYTLTWSEGRNLDSLTYSGNTTQYRYDADGLRTRKIKSDGSYVNYFYAEGVLAGEAHYSSTGAAQYYLKFAYDESGSPAAFGYWGTGATSWDIYYYVKNLQGDVVAVYSESTGAVAASYEYDSWGNVISSSGSMAAVNPLTYRGYYRDSESWFYYLNTRYYDPAVGRFISADIYVSTGQGLLGYNMFAYCNNDPVNYKDPYGLFRFLDYALFDYTAMHTMTQIKCVYDYGFAMEVYVKTGDKKGRLDLYDPVHNEFYEVKSDGCKDSDDTKKQIKRYKESVIQDTNGNKGKLGIGAIGKKPRPGENKDINGSFEYWIYDVEYHYYSPGLIIYSKQPNWERANALALCGVIAVAGVLSGGTAFAIGAGALAAGYIY